MAGFFKATGDTAPPTISTVPSCGACGLFKDCNSPKQGYTGEGQKGILLVASSPSSVDGGDERPFGGSYGPAVRRALAERDIDMNKDCWKIGAIACRPAKGRFPAAAEVEYCRPMFAASVAKLKPKIIIPFGYAATIASIGLNTPRSGGPEVWPGWRIPDQKLNAWICPTWHPAEIAKSKESDVMELAFGRHLDAASGLRRRPWPDDKTDWTKEVRRIHSDEEAAAAIKDLVLTAHRKKQAIAWDLETNMLKPDPKDAQIVCCALSRGSTAPEETIAYPWGPKAREATGKFLRSPIPKIAANLKFEDRWCREEFGHRVRAWAWDTVVQAHVLDNRPNISGVKFQSYVLLGQHSYEKSVGPFLKAAGSMEKNRINQVDMDKILLYCGMDGLLEFRIAIRQAKLMHYTLPWLR